MREKGLQCKMKFEIKDEVQEKVKTGLSYCTATF